MDDADQGIIGLVGALGAGGGSVGGLSDWDLIFHLAAWRHPGSAVVVAERRCLLRLPETELRGMMNRIEPYSILEMEAEADPDLGVARLRRIVEFAARDAELEEIATRLKRPILLPDSTFGTLEYDRRFKEYSGRVLWHGQEIDLGLECPDPADPGAVLEAAKQLFDDQAGWHRRVVDYAVAQLLPLKNDSWLGEDEAAVTPDECRARMSLQAISIDSFGNFAFWHNDGGLFWGHSILISGDLVMGPTDADTPG